jgi:hypothetical protein
MRRENSGSERTGCIASTGKWLLLRAAGAAVVPEDEDRDGKGDEAKDDESTSPGGTDGSRLTTPIAVTVEPENPIGPPQALKA